eukprot:symbB.v1.2.011435.t1/scaffold767.1/size164079/6
MPNPRPRGWHRRAPMPHEAHHGAVHEPEMLRPRRFPRSQEGPWFLAPRSTPEAALVKLREPLQPDRVLY